uniref:ATP synthase F0 subunit 8 n=2 Tax=Boreoeutheria TaxID=1437010 RepID=M9NB21_CERPT
MPQLDTSTW